ncbi:hypothetical protein FDO65_09980 [Nakamurella flava]|uniref:Uncharacterized protein n=1 Tax=Nakamurella flava TaxID=2576308 RepID=A0A4V6CWC6_9ACTN|nr:hypothetical protein [Nakamurella flava]TKV61845.1 hypothetical protein FDO65_09980 [Nakamurella flava]
MTAPARPPRVLVRPASAEWDCGGCGAWKVGVDWIGPVEDLFAVAIGHAQNCKALHLARLRYDVSDQASFLRLRATHLESTSRETGELPFPWVELRAAARQLDELVTW